MANPGDRYALTRGVRALLTQIAAALDVPPGDPRVVGHAATVAGTLRAALKDNATDHDCLILAGIIKDSMAITATGAATGHVTGPLGTLTHRVPADPRGTHRVPGDTTPGGDVA
jgi:hypothetical protein